MTTITKGEPTISDREVLTGLVERVTYHNAENGFCVVRVKARGRRELVTVVGHAAGEWITATGKGGRRWCRHYCARIRDRWAMGLGRGYPHVAVESSTHSGRGP